MSKSIELHSIAENMRQTNYIIIIIIVESSSQEWLDSTQWEITSVCICFIDVIWSYHIHTYVLVHTTYILRDTTQIAFFYFNGINEIAKFKYTCVKWSIIIICLLVNSFVRSVRTHSQQNVSNKISSNLYNWTLQNYYTSSVIQNVMFWFSSFYWFKKKLDFSK